MNFTQFLTKTVLTSLLGINLVFSEEGNQQVLVLGANQFVETSWTESHDVDGVVWANSLWQHGIDLTTINEYPSISSGQNHENLGLHITLNWDDDSQLQTNLVDSHAESYDLITNDYGVSYFIHDKTLPSFLKTLKVGGQFVYGPLTTHTCTTVSVYVPLTQNNIELVTEPEDISFYRHGIGILNFGHLTSFNITMTRNTEESKLHHLEQIDSWPGIPVSTQYISGVNTSKNLLRTFIDDSYERMTIANFTNFINEQCGFGVAVELKTNEDEEIQEIFNTILPPEHPGTSWGIGDWVIMTRTTE